MQCDGEKRLIAYPEGLLSLSLAHSLLLKISLATGTVPIATDENER